MSTAREQPTTDNPFDLDDARHACLAPGGYNRNVVALAADRIVGELDAAEQRIAAARAALAEFDPHDPGVARILAALDGRST